MNQDKESRFARYARYFTNEKALANPSYANDTILQAYMSSDESMVYIRHHEEKSDCDKSDSGGEVEENMVREKEILPTVAEFREAESDSDQVDSGSWLFDTHSQTDTESESDGEQEPCPCMIHTPEFEGKLLSAVAGLIDSQFRAEIPQVVDKAVQETTEELHKIAQDAAREEIGKYIMGIHPNDSGDEELALAQFIENRLKEFDEETLERVYMQRSMVAVLKRLVEKAESDLALLEWGKV
ncbi:hypothetical protein PG997_011443 [Apiospora hydei]|uniref:Uncharacterized protein n=1 Tax=Apiospora hydei TaxID=1337664 RepID=A0ABR1VLZ6_9PEZI